MDREAQEQEAEDYKQIWNAILEIEKRIPQILTASTAVSVALLSAIAGVVFGKTETSSKIIVAYALLAPNFITIPSFCLMLSQRIDIIRLGSYRRVFFEELCDRTGWERRLKEFRARERKESLNPVPLSVWAIFAPSALLFFYAVDNNNLSCFNLVVLIVPAAIIGWLHCRWDHVISTDMPRHIDRWKEVSRLEREPNK